MDPADPALRCPRCRYDLRGQLEPRCPECGLTFPPAAWAVGQLRDSRPTTLDRADLWQPHQVLIRTLYELIAGALRPRYRRAHLDLDAPVAPALVMLVVGLAWVYVLLAALVAFGESRSGVLSPWLAVRHATQVIAPAILLTAFVVVAGALPLALRRRALRVPRITLRGWVRTAGYSIPSFILYWVPALGVAIVLDEHGPLWFVYAPAVLVLLCAIPPLRSDRTRGNTGDDRPIRRAGIIPALILFAFGVGGAYFVWVDLLQNLPGPVALLVR